MKNENKVFLWSAAVALAGFLFGFDTVVISGADLALQELWPKGDFYHGFVIMASALWGTVFGAIFGSYPTDKYGRKNTLIIIGFLYLISALGSALANGPEIFAFFRFIGGIGVGASTIAAPAYIAEIAPAKSRGRLVALYQFNIVFGILIAFISNYLLQNFGQEPWRAMVGAEAIPAFVYVVIVFFIPESPRWLLTHKSDFIGAERSLSITDPNTNTKILMDQIVDEHKNTSIKDSIFGMKHRFPLILAFLIAFFNQFSGINALLYYAPRIFEIAGIDKSDALFSSVGIGITNLIFTILGLSLIDKLGRRQLMFIGSVGYIVSLLCVSISFFFNLKGMFVPVFFFIFIASHAIGQGAVIWVFISEIFPNHLRARGQAFGSSVHWVLAAAIPAAIPLLFNTIGAGFVFLVFAFMMVLQLIFVWKMMPETKGVPLEELEKELRLGR